MTVSPHPCSWGLCPSFPPLPLSACALPRVFHSQAAGLLQHLGPERAAPLAKPHSHLCRQSAPRGAAGGVHSGGGVAGRRPVEIDTRKQALVTWPPDRGELSEGKRLNPRLTCVRREKL